jgi:hypothetical protein
MNQQEKTEKFNQYQNMIHKAIHRAEFQQERHFLPVEYEEYYAVACELFTVICNKEPDNFNAYLSKGLRNGLYRYSLEQNKITNNEKLVEEDILIKTEDRMEQTVNLQLEIEKLSLLAKAVIKLIIACLQRFA